MTHRSVAMSMRITGSVVLAFCTAFAGSIAADIDIQPGAQMSLGGGTVQLGCTDISVGGDLTMGEGSILGALNVVIPGGTADGGSGQINLAGDWNNQGIFTPGTSLVSIEDNCLVLFSAVSGDTDFYDFSVVSAGGRTLQPESGSTQTFQNSLTLQGVSGTPLQIRSNAPGNQAFFELDPAGTQNIFAVDVQDNNASGGQHLAPDFPEAFDSIDSGNNLNWFIGVVREFIPVPTLSWPALILLALSLMTAAFRRRHLFSFSDK